MGIGNEGGGRSQINNDAAMPRCREEENLVRRESRKLVALVAGRDGRFQGAMDGLTGRGRVV